jgi:hypothetical protein
MRVGYEPKVNMTANTLNNSGKLVSVSALAAVYNKDLARLRNKSISHHL